MKLQSLFSSLFGFSKNTRTTLAPTAISGAKTTLAPDAFPEADLLVSYMPESWLRENTAMTRDDIMTSLRLRMLMMDHQIDNNLIENCLSGINGAENAAELMATDFADFFATPPPPTVAAEAHLPLDNNLEIIFEKLLNEEEMNGDRLQSMTEVDVRHCLESMKHFQATNNN